VLDIDPRHGGDVWEAAHADQLPRTRMHSTQHDGRHRLFRHAAGVRNRSGCPAPGVDVRGEGGYIIAPPSPGYSIVDAAPIAEWPAWLLEVVRRSPEQPRRPAIAADPSRITDARLDGLLRSLLARVSAAPEGQKHDVLRAISRTVGGYAHLLVPHTDEQLTELLLDAVQDWKLARRTAASSHHPRLMTARNCTAAVHWPAISARGSPPAPPAISSIPPASTASTSWTWRRTQPVSSMHRPRRTKPAGMPDGSPPAQKMPSPTVT
jgi:hypothetical protein